MNVETRPLDELLKQSAATDEFKAAVHALERGAPPGERIAFNATAPPVKVLRAICKLLETRPEWAVQSVSIDATSGCSDFTGAMTVQPGGHAFEFVWDCKWRAMQMGWTDPLGLPDQVRAARECGYQCFERFELAGS